MSRFGLTLVAVCTLCYACSSDDDSNPTGGSGGTGGASGGSGGAGGRGGSGGSGGTGGASGGSGGATGGSGGSGGATGGTGGATGGSGGSGGSSADAGDMAASDASVADAPSTSGDGGGGGMSFFLTSRKGGGNLGGLEGADMICKTLATAVGAGSRNWKAYLSTGSPVVHAKDRIGNGPWFNAKGVMVAANLTQLHDGATPMNNLTATTVLDENGMAIPGRMNRPAGTSNEHDIITGTQMDGTVAMGFTCGDWRMESAMARVGHFDRGGGGGTLPMTDDTSWNSSHNNQGCSPTTIMPGGGAGRFYCFAAD
jgi:hypothetical protein